MLSIKLRQFQQILQIMRICLIDQLLIRDLICPEPRRYLGLECTFDRHASEMIGEIEVSCVQHSLGAKRIGL